MGRIASTSIHPGAVVLRLTFTDLERLSLASLERNLERALHARTGADLDAIATELLPAQAN